VVGYQCTCTVRLVCIPGSVGGELMFLIRGCTTLDICYKCGIEGVGKFRPRRSIKVYPEVRSILSRIRKVAQNVSVSNFVRMLPMESNVLGSSTSLWVAYSCWSSRCLNCCFTFSCFNYFHSTTNSRGLIPHPLHPRAPAFQELSTESVLYSNSFSNKRSA
jgi:hypothetical protein